MVIAVFDSGLGSLSVIQSIQQATKSEIIYFADQKNFPYGKKTKQDLKKIIKNTITKLQEVFHPDIIVMASNTPSVLFPEYLNSNVIGVLPPIKQAVKITKTNKIAILATTATIQSTEITKYIKNQVRNIQVKKIDATELIGLVESGKFLTDKKQCVKTIRKTLAKQIGGLDVITLSSTHLPFLLPMLKKEFPTIQFLDPADNVAQKIAKRIKKKSKNRLQIYTSADPKILQKHLQKLGIKNKVSFLP
ncbi:MAG: glutamate racemase [Nitrososphaeria archaeon]|nr:glutamate racemase [Nitrososphaeria archaeon]NDF48015.1 glutamate racemase [Nitrosopumilaceae archaeon]